MAITLEHIREQSPARPSKDSPRRTAKLRVRFFGPFRRSVKRKELIFFTSQLSLMLEIGISLVEALTAIEEQTGNPDFKAVIRVMRQDIEEGGQLSDAMGKYPEVFNSIFTSMIKAAETGGFLKKTLDSIVSIQEKRQVLVTQLRSTLTYPAVLCAVAVAVVIFVLVGILPKFTAIFQGKENLLPLTTRFLMASSAALRGYWWAFLAAIGLLALGFKFWKDSDRGQAAIDWVVVNTPLLSRTSNKIYTCQLLRTLGYLMESRVPLLQALFLTRTNFHNRFFIHFIDSLSVNVEKGGKFSQPFSGNPYILPSVKQMVTTAEEVGNLPHVMLRLADFYDVEIDRELKTIASMIEPLALIVLGAVVGLIVSSVILPMFKIASMIR